MPVGELRIRLLGGLAVDGLSDHDLGSRKGRQALKVLALAAGAPVLADVLVDALWGDRPPARPTEQLGVLVSRLRGVLGADRVVKVDAGYRLAVDWLDVDELRVRVEEAAAALAGGRVGAARAAAGAALALARGALLPEEDGDWVTGARAAVAGVVGRAHHLAAEAAAAAGDPGASAAAAEAALAHDPYDEVALRLLMLAHAAAGRPASALAAYARVREQLVEDLGLDPTAETEALHDRVVLGPSDGAAPTAAGPTAAGPAGGGAGRAGQSQGPVELVGRDGELAQLDASLTSVAAGGALVVVVRGEAGIGKSALVGAWSSRLGERAAVLLGRCDELGRDLPLQPVSDALSSHLRALGPAAATELLGEEAPVLAELLGVASPVDTATTIADAARGQAALFAALLAVVGRIGAGGPVALAIEDLHLAGPSTLAWLAFARRRGSRLLVLATCRPGSIELTGADDLHLGPIDEAAAAALTGIGGARLAELHTRSGGNPLFLMALAGAGGSDALPSSVRAAAEAQASQLGTAAATVRAAAVLGTEVDLDLLAEVLRRPAVDVLGELEVAVEADLLVERGDGLAFRHALVREALAASVSAARRALLHRDAARALEARPRPDPLAVAVHARLGGDEDRAVAAYVLAAGEASARFDVAAAAAHLDLAMSLGGSAAAFTARARLRMATLQLDAAAADAASAMALATTPAVLEVAGWIAYYRRRYDEAMAFADEGVAVAGDDQALRASCLAVAGRVRHGAGDLVGAMDRLGAVTSAPPPVQGVADVWRAGVEVHQGNPAAALQTLVRPLVAPERLAHPWAGLHGRFSQAMAFGALGRIAEGLHACDHLDEAVLRGGAVGARFLGPAANVRAWLLRGVGEVAAADERNLECLDRTSGVDGGPASDAVAEYHYVALLDLADGRLHAGDPDGATTLVGRLAAVDGWKGTMAWHQRHRLGLLRSRLALLAGDDAGAAAAAAAVADDARARGAGRYLVLATAWLALAGGEGDLDRVGAVVAALPGRAAMEGWRLSDALGACFGVDAWRTEAARGAGAIAAEAGTHADGFRRLASATLG